MKQRDQEPTDPSTPETPQPTSPYEGGSVGPTEGVPGGPKQVNPDPGIEQHPHKARPLPPVVPEEILP